MSWLLASPGHQETWYRKAMASFRVSTHKLELKNIDTQKTISREIIEYAHYGREITVFIRVMNFSSMSSVYDQQRKQLFQLFGKECKNFNQLEEWGKFVFMLNSEGKLTTATGKTHNVISVTRGLHVNGILAFILWPPLFTWLAIINTIAIMYNVLICWNVSEQCSCVCVVELYCCSTFDFMTMYLKEAIKILYSILYFDIDRVGDKQVLVFH